MGFLMLGGKNPFQPDLEFGHFFAVIDETLELCRIFEMLMFGFVLKDLCCRV